MMRITLPVFLAVAAVLSVSCVQQQAPDVGPMAPVAIDDFPAPPEWSEALEHYDSYVAAGGKITPLIKLLRERMEQAPGQNSFSLAKLMDHYLSFREGKEPITAYPYAISIAELYERGGEVPLEAVQEIFAAGADPNVRDAYGTSALAYALQLEDCVILEYLRAGANVNAPLDKDGKNTMDRALKNKKAGSTSFLKLIQVSAPKNRKIV